MLRKNGYLAENLFKKVNSAEIMELFFLKSACMQEKDVTVTPSVPRGKNKPAAQAAG